MPLVGFQVWCNFNLRMGWDLNPRCTFAHAGFRNRCLQPLSHPSLGPPKLESYEMRRRPYLKPTTFCLFIKKCYDIYSIFVFSFPLKSENFKLKILRFAELAPSS